MAQLAERIRVVRTGKIGRITKALVEDGRGNVLAELPITGFSKNAKFDSIGKATIELYEFRVAEDWVPDVKY